MAVKVPTPLVGMPVVYQQAVHDDPLGGPVADRRIHPALIARVRGPGIVDLIVFPFGIYRLDYFLAIPYGHPAQEDRCWFEVEAQT